MEILSLRKRKKKKTEEGKNKANGTYGTPLRGPKYALWKSQKKRERKEQREYQMKQWLKTPQI